MNILTKRPGLAQIPLMIVLLLMAAALPVVTKLVTQNQENRTKATVCTPGARVCNTSGGYNMCSSDGANWYSYTCPSGSCSGSGNCTAVTCSNPYGNVGDKICNTAGGYNQCSSSGNWYGYSCGSGQKCSGGNCVANTCSNPYGNIGDRVCNTAGGYNMCSSSGNWYGYSCGANQACSGGNCIQVVPTATPIPVATS